MHLRIRPALESDWPAIRELLMEAFGNGEGGEIVDLVAALLEDGSAAPSCSLVAEADGAIAGHILFTRARVPDPDIPSSLLAPLAVRPAFQGQGIGGALIAEGLKCLRSAGTDLVFVLGHPGYYPRAGFAPAGVQGLDAPYAIPPENAGAWMVQELRPGAIDRANGTVTCAKALSDPKYWRE